VVEVGRLRRKPQTADIQSPSGCFVLHVLPEQAMMYRVEEAGSPDMLMRPMHLSSRGLRERARMSEKIKRGQRIPVPLLRGQHRLIVQHALAKDHSFERAVLAGEKRQIDVTLTELEDLLGCIVTAANGCSDGELEYSLDALYDRLDGILYSYEEID
jgi:hypothetical protein